MLSHKLNSDDQKVAESIFENLKACLPTPPGFDRETMKSSVSWLKLNSPSLEDCLNELERAAFVLQKMNYEVLVLETESLEGILYEDSAQILTAPGKNAFRVQPFADLATQSTSPT